MLNNPRSARERRTRRDQSTLLHHCIAPQDSVPASTYELAGHASFSMSDFAWELTYRAGKEAVDNELEPEAYRNLLAGPGLPPSS